MHGFSRSRRGYGKWLGKWAGLYAGDRYEQEAAGVVKLTPVFRTIVADPPWKVHRPPAWGDGPNRPLPYPTMSLAEIEALPIGELADDLCHLYVWTINRYVEATYRIVRAWGFRPSSLLVWGKAPAGLGGGGHYVNTTEYILFARRGTEGANPAYRHPTTWWNWKRGEHSAKPDAFLDIVEQVSPGPYLEIFARRARFGWEYAGDGSHGTVEIPGLRAPGEVDAPSEEAA